jgi:hypothetical protein
VCVCVKEGGRDGEREKEREKEKGIERERERRRTVLEKKRDFALRKR